MMEHSAAAWCEKQLQNPNPSLYNDELWEVAKGSCSYSRTSTGATISIFPNCISAISSMLIIYIILISQEKLSSTYHRIMLGVSFSDILCCIPCALSSLPMPSPGDYWTDSYNIPSTRIGNTQTCTAQGFFLTFGLVSFSIYDSISLAVFYLCSIGFQMTSETMKKYLEPLIHIMPIGAALMVALPPLLQDNYNPSIVTPWCIISPKPWFCTNENNNGVECIRGVSPSNTTGYIYDSKFLSKALSIFMIWRFLCLGLLCWMVYRTERQIAKLIEQEYDDMKRRRSTMHCDSVSSSWIPLSSKVDMDELQGGKVQRGQLKCIESGQEEVSMQELTQIKKDQYTETKIIASQAMLYILSSVLTNYTLVIFFSLPDVKILYKSEMLVLTSLEGLYNLLIFTFHKVYKLKRCNRNISFLAAMKQIFRNGGVHHDSLVISSMAIVSQQSSSNNDLDGNEGGFLFDDNYDDSSKLTESATEQSKIFHMKRTSSTRGPFPFYNSTSIASCSLFDVSNKVGSSAMSRNSIGSSFSYLDNDFIYDESGQQSDDENTSLFSSSPPHQSKEDKNQKQSSPLAAYKENLGILQLVSEEDDENQEEEER
jgi:hypothetical protein